MHFPEESKELTFLILNTSLKRLFFGGKKKKKKKPFHELWIFNL